MPRISIEHLAFATRQVRGMTLAQKAAVMDDVHAQQPHMLGSLLVQQQLGVSLERMDRFVGAMQFQSALSREIGERALGEYISKHSEKALLAIVNAELIAGRAHLAPLESDKHLMVAAINYVNCIANAPLPADARSTRARRRPGKR